MGIAAYQKLPDQPLTQKPQVNKNSDNLNDQHRMLLVIALGNLSYSRTPPVDKPRIECLPQAGKSEWDWLTMTN